MQYQTEILRFKEGARSRHPSPEATVAAAQPNALSDAGDQIAVLVDLTPQLPYRSREIRSLVVKTYWNSSGSIVARLRRALVAANRHLVSFNRKAASGNKCAGNITCAVFSDGELFLGQVGAAYAYVYHGGESQPPPTIDDVYPGDPVFEIFPKRDRLLVPLGGTVPPVINIGYTVMTPESIACLATTRVAEALARETWQQTLALPKFNAIASELAQAFASRRISGSVILFRGQASPRQSTTLRHPAQPSTERAAPALEPVDQREVAASLTPIPKPKGAAASHPSVPSAGAEEVATAPGAEGRRSPLPTRVTPQDPSDLDDDWDAWEDEEEDSPIRPSYRVSAEGPSADQRRTTRPPVSLSLPPVGKWIRDMRERARYRRELRKAQAVDRTTTAERARLRQALRTLLPGKVEGPRSTAAKTPPPERTSLMGGLTLGFLVIVALISVTMYFQFGGPLRAQELLADAHQLRDQAYSSQSPNDWHQLLETADQIVRLDPQNQEAQALLDEAQQAVNTLESAAVLSVTPLLDLGTAPRPRRLLIADGWVYMLNTATDAVMALPLNEDGLSSSAGAPTTILRRGQTYLGEVVNHLVDLSWIDPGGNYPDGAVFIYSEGGAIFIYEPALGPGSITVQHVEGNLAPGNITVMETFGEKFYLVNRQVNQILMYEPLNGIYESPRTYFAEGTAPDLQLTLDMAIDGRLYLLMGDGTIQTFFAGSYDHSFEMSGLPDANFKPLVIAIEPDPEEGLVYLAETQRERIIVLDKRGEFVRQYKLPKGELKRIEALALDGSASTLYLIAENRLFAAPLPTFETNSP